MSPRIICFLAAALLMLVLLASAAIHSYLRARRSSAGTWESLLKRLILVDRGAIAAVALDVIDESGQQRRDDNSAMMAAPEIWKLIGGWDGMEALEANSTVLIDLACFVQQWYPEKALLVAEQLRLNAREIQWHVERLESSAKTGNLECSIIMNAQRVAVTYFLMTRNILALYEYDSDRMLADLQRAL